MQGSFKFKDVGLLQIDTKRGTKRVLNIVQAFTSDLQNIFLTQAASKEVWTQEWGIDSEHCLEFDKLQDGPIPKTLKSLRFHASNRGNDESARKMGAAVFLDCSKYPRALKTWNVTFFKGETSGKILISKRIAKTYKASELLKSGDANHKLFDYVDSVYWENLNLSGVGDSYKVFERRRNFLVFKTEEELKAQEAAKQEAAKPVVQEKPVSSHELFRHPKLSTVIETSQYIIPNGKPPVDTLTFYTEYSIDSSGQYHKVREFRDDFDGMVEYRKSQLAKVLLAESIVEEQEQEVKAAESDKINVIEEALKACGVKAHACTQAIVDFLYTQVYVESNDSVTRPQIISHILENYEWSASTIRRKIQKLERDGFIKELPGQTTIKEFKILGFDLAFETKIKEICEARGFKFGGKLSVG